MSELTRHIKMNDYQGHAIDLAFYPAAHRITYPVLGLVGEAGEVAEKWKKVLRDADGWADDHIKLEMARELGDVLWYVAILASDLGVPLSTIARMNLEKLWSRQVRGTQGGSGDNR